jgi:hypothetical protein
LTDADVRETPHEFFAELDKRYKFDLDACATHANAKCPLYFTVDGHWAAPVENGIRVPGEAMFLGGADGLSGSWKGRRVWCNPPYSDIEPWLVKAWNSDADLVVTLLPASRTDQGWWRKHVEQARDLGCGEYVPLDWNSFRTEFIRGRLKFLKDGKPLGSPRFGSVLLIWQR